MGVHSSILLLNISKKLYNETFLKNSSLIFFSLFKNPYVLSNLMAPKPGRLSSPFRFLACFQRCHSCLVWATAQDQLCPCPSRDLS